ncbi:hypothetical protein HPB47_025005 [Ixodes persulcatus]|uniref:Uncharacterized protein n=1 Tax=Ixodes persulcatus TaxID=34615 RepID=A0AC60Q2S2_IXOPE|nr:hypothetical protein HPB47_025005 [Ixodes persulcatus]
MKTGPGRSFTTSRLQTVCARKGRGEKKTGLSGFPRLADRRKIRRARRDPGGTGDGGAEIGHGDGARDGRRLRAPENCSPLGSPAPRRGPRAVRRTLVYVHRPGNLSRVGAPHETQNEQSRLLDCGAGGIPLTSVEWRREED